MDENDTKFIKNLRKRLDSDVVTPEDLKKVVDYIIGLLKESNEFHTKNGSVSKSELMEAVSAVSSRLETISSEITAAIKDVEVTGQNEINKLVKNVYREIQSVRGLIPQVDFTSVFNRIIELERKIPKIPEELTSEEVRDKLASLAGSERLDKSAIKGLEEELNTLKKTRIGGGGTSTPGIIHAFKTALKTEEPVGDIDGVNTTYTVSQPIFAIFSFALNGEIVAQLPNYTISDRTVTFSSALPAAYSGKDFEIKYI